MSSPTSPGSGGVRNVHSDKDRDAWIGIQRKTFSRWANQYLPADSKIEDLVADLSDGLVLSRLLSRISEEDVGKMNKNPRMDIQKLENLNQCLAFIRAHDIPLVNIGSSDILKGNEKLVLGLLWTIILRFEVSGADGKAGLLLWLQRSTKGYDGVEVKDFTSSWADGKAFNALIHRYRPDLVDFDAVAANDDALARCETAFAAAESGLGIARLLDPEDVVAGPEDKSQVAYLSQFFKLFAGQAKLEAKLKAIKNAVAVTRRHDEWMATYTDNSQRVQAFAAASSQRFAPGTASSSSDDGGNNASSSSAAPTLLPRSTEEVARALDAFATYMREEKPQMAAARAECEGVFTTLASSKRNNDRPPFAPPIAPEALSAQWDALEQLEQSHERDMLDRYLAYKLADRAVAKFSAKAVTVGTYLDEKLAAFAEGALPAGAPLPQLETELETVTAAEARLALYDQSVAELRPLVERAAAAPGHAGAALAAQGLVALEGKASECRARAQAHRAAVASAIEAERELVGVEKQYLRDADPVDFAVDELEELSGENMDGATAAEMAALQASLSGFTDRVAAARAQLSALSALAEKIAARRPAAQEHCAQQQARLEAVTQRMESQQAAAQQALADEQRRDELSQAFAAQAADFAAFCDAQRAGLAALSGSLEDQQAALAALRADTAGSGPEAADGADAAGAEPSAGGTKLAALAAAARACEEASVVANRYTTHTIHSLRSEHEQLLKAMKRADDALTAQLLAQKSLQVPPEQLKEISEVFAAFDADRDGKLRLADLREACRGAGIDLADAELEQRMRQRSSSMLFSLDDFVAFFLEELQTGDSKQDVLDAFKVLAPAGQGKVSTQDIDKAFGGAQPELAAYLAEQLQDGDYARFAEELFSR